jgi:hypothetical protein
MRCLGNAVDPVREHEYFHHHGGGADGGFNKAGVTLTGLWVRSAKPILQLN